MSSELFAGEVKSGDYRRGLVALRDRLAAACVDAEPRELAPLARQLALVLRELDGLTVPKGSVVDDLRARRVARVANSSGSDSS